MADPDYVGWALGTAANNRAATQAANDQYALFATRMAGGRIAQGDYAGAANSLGQAGDVQGAQALQRGGAMQSALTAESAGDVQAARAAAAATGNQSSYDAAQQGAMQTAVQKAGALNWLADHIASIPQAPGDATGDPNTPRAKALSAAIGTGMLQSMGMAHDGLTKLVGAPLDDSAISAYRARIPFSGSLKGEGGVETVYAGGTPVARGYTAPVKLDPGQSLVPASGGAPIASNAPLPADTKPGDVLKDQRTGQPLGTQTAYPYDVTSNSQTGGVNVTNPNLPTAAAPSSATLPDGSPSRSPASLAYSQPSGAAGTNRPGINAANSAQAYGPLIAQVEQANGIPSGMLSRLIGAESGGNPAAVSSKGAQGIAQLMPATAADLGVDPHDPVASIQAAGRYLAQNARQFGGDWTKAAAAYNAGPGTVSRYGGVPPYRETQGFVAQVAPPQGGQAAPPAGVPGPGQTVQSGGNAVRQLSPEEVAARGFPAGAVVTQKPNGDLDVRSTGNAYTLDNANAVRNQFGTGKAYEAALNAATAASTMHRILANAKGNSGVVDMAGVDNAVRTATGLSARPGSLEIFLDHVPGFPDELKGRALSMFGNGFVTPKTLRGLVDMMDDYSDTHTAVAQQVADNDEAFAKQNGFSGGLGLNVPKRTGRPYVKWLDQGSTPQIRNADDYAELPKGTAFIDPNGVQRVKR